MSCIRIESAALAIAAALLLSTAPPRKAESPQEALDAKLTKLAAGSRLAGLPSPS